jgi:hypothetical protein
LSIEMPVPHQILGRFPGRTSGVNDTKLADESRKNRIKYSRDYLMLEVIILQLRATGCPQKCTPDGFAMHRSLRLWTEEGDGRPLGGKTRQEYE